jgi:hypothetical protein
MSLEESKNELVEKYGLYGASAVLVVQKIENDRILELDLSTITELWNKTYRELTSRNSMPKNGCVFQSFVSLILRGHVKFNRDISIKETCTFGKNYDYVKATINILKSDYGSRWPNTLKAPELWKEVFLKLKRREIAHNLQLHVLKALVENGMIGGLGIS